MGQNLRELYNDSTYKLTQRRQHFRLKKAKHKITTTYIP